MLIALRRVFLKVFVKQDTTSEDRHRRVYLALLSLAYPAAASVFVWFHLQAGRTEEGLVILAAIVAVLGCLLFTRFAEDLSWAYRLCGLVVLGVLAYQLSIGGGGGFASLWFFMIPPVGFYLFGTREGAVWAVLFYSVAAGLLVGGVGTVYPVPLVSRFLVSLAIVTVLAGLYQRSRQRLFADLRAEKEELEGALSEVRTLSGMLPVCAWCRNVRDDDGYWSRLEDYVSRRTGAMLSHGLCPDCATKMTNEHPDLQDESGLWGGPDAEGSAGAQDDV